MTSIHVSVGQLRQAIVLKEHIEQLQGELEGILNGGQSRISGNGSRGRPPLGGRRRMAVAGRA